jgi:hypothetical protein
MPTTRYESSWRSDNKIKGKSALPVQPPSPRGKFLCEYNKLSHNKLTTIARSNLDVHDELA